MHIGMKVMTVHVCNSQILASCERTVEKPKAQHSVLKFRFIEEEKKENNQVPHYLYFWYLPFNVGASFDTNERKSDRMYVNYIKSFFASHILSVQPQRHAIAEPRSVHSNNIQYKKWNTKKK